MPKSRKFVSELPFSKRKALCAVLDMHAKWSELASDLGYDAQEIHQFASAVYRLPGYNSPSEDLLTEYCHSNPTIDELYFKLNKLNLVSAADKIKEFVSRPAQNHGGDGRSMRNANEGTDEDSSHHDLPTPSQRPIQLKPTPNIHGVSALGYTRDPFSDSNNSSGPAYQMHGMRHNDYRTNNQHHGKPNNFLQPIQNQHPPNPARMQINITPPSSNGAYMYDYGAYHGPKSNYDLGSANPLVGANPIAQNGDSAQQQPFPGRSVLAPNAFKQESVMQAPIGCSTPIGNPNQRFPPQPVATQMSEINYATIKRATYGFDKRNLISEDRFGMVFRGKMGNQTLAIKQMKKIKDDKSGFDITTHLAKEVDTLKRCNHPNIIRLLHFINASEGEGDVYLVYPFMEHGSLRKNLAGRENLKWEYRVKILQHAASGLNYLHNILAENPYIHGDISSDNILLDGNMTAKLTGFGLAHAATGGGIFDQHTHVSQAYLKNTLFGAVEYMPPEFKDMPQLSTKGDVFALGVVILETCTGLASHDERREGGKSLWEYVANLGDDTTTFAESLNDRRQPMPLVVWEKVFNLGKKCISLKKKHRPSAKEAHEILDEICKTMRNGTGRRSSNENPPVQQRANQNGLSMVSSGSIAPIKLPNRQQHKGAEYSVVSPDFDHDIESKLAVENTTTHSACTEEDDDDIIFERPGNTTQIPMFEHFTEAHNTNNGPSLLAACQEHDSYKTPSDLSDHHVLSHSGYDYAKSDMSIITGSCDTSEHEYRKHDMDILSGSTDASKDDKNKSDYYSNTSDKSDCSKGENNAKSSEFQDSSSVPHETPPGDIAGFDFRKNDLDILSDSANSTSKSHSNAPGFMDLPLPSAAASCHGNQSSQLSTADSNTGSTTEEMPQSDDVCTSLHGNSTQDDILNLPDQFNMLGLATHAQDTSPGPSSFISDESLHILHPGRNTNHQSAVTHNVPQSASAPKSDVSNILDDSVILNDSVVMYAGKRESSPENDNNYPVATNQSLALKTIGETDFNFNLSQDDNVSDVGINVDNIKQKADMCKFFDSDDGDSFSQFDSDFSQNQDFALDLH